VNKRIPPHSTDAERGVVGCLLVRPELLADVLDTGLSVADFYTPKWAASFSAILALASRGDAVDTTTVIDELAGGAHGTAPDGLDVLDAISGVASLSHAVNYAVRIVEYAGLRRIITACVEITESAYGPDAKADSQGFADLGSTQQ